MFVLVILASLVLVAAVMFINKKRVDSLRDEFASDPDVEIPPGSWTLKMQTREPKRFATVVQAGGGKNDPPRWDARTGVKLNGTSLHLSREGVLGAFRNMLGFQDINVGDETFDSTFTVRGSDADEVRRLLADVNVRQAVHDLFNGNVWSFTVDETGGVHVRAARSGMDAHGAKRVLLGMVALCDALDGQGAAVNPGGARASWSA